MPVKKQPKKVVLIGGPGTGKTSVLNALKKRDFTCMEEISRAVTLKAQSDGINQLFLEKPLLFSKLLLQGREKQFLEAEKKDEKIIFFDRGIPDIHAYMNYFNTEYPSFFIEKSKQYQYDAIFIFSPWQEIYTSDNERYETFEEAIKIQEFLKNAYQELGYTTIQVPFDSIENRADFIVNSLSDTP